MQRYSLIASSLMGVALVCADAHANPWLKDEGAGEVISSTTLTQEDAGLAPGATVQSTSELHLEYGAASRATLLLDTDFQQQTAAGQNRTNFDNAWGGARVALSRWDNSLLSIEAGGGISGVRQSAFTQAISLHGRGEARLMFGQGFSVLSRHAFASIEVGWRWRGGAPADELIADAGVGIEPWSSGLVMLQSFSIIGTGTATGAYRRYDLSKLQLSIAQRISQRLWLQAGAVSIIAGAGSGEVGGVFALWWRF